MGRNTSLDLYPWESGYLSCMSMRNGLCDSRSSILLRVMTRTYLKIVVSMKTTTYNAPHASIARRTMGTDSGTLSRGAHSRKSPRAQARAGARRLGGRAVDSEHGCAMAHAAPVLSQLQDGASTVSAVVRTRGAARDSHAAGEHVARGRRARRTGELHRCDVCLGQRRWRWDRQNPPWQRRQDSRDCGSPWAAALGEHACGQSS